MVEVCVDSHHLARLLGLVTNTDNGGKPGIGLVNDSLGGNTKSLGGESETTNIGHGNKLVADEFDVFGLEVVAVSSRDDNVLETWLAANIVQHLLPTSQLRLRRVFHHLFGRGTNSPSSSAPLAVRRAYRVGCSH